MKIRLHALLLCALPGLAAAQALTGVTAEPKDVRVGQPVTITSTFDNIDNPNCGLRLQFGDGQQTDYKINQPKDIPLVVTHTYDKPGSFEIMAEPKRNGMILGCTGKNQRIKVNVAAAASAPAASAAASGPGCPDGWKLDGKSVNKKTGAFTCAAKAGTAAPANKLACPGDLGYFENAKKGQLGCKP